MRIEADKSAVLLKEREDISIIAYVYAYVHI
jgi:hypothetical protein